MSQRINRKKLLPEEAVQYEEFGTPDLSQDWLELFAGTLVEDLFAASHSCSDNHKKAEYVLSELSYYGFTLVGEGTNICTLANPAYPGVVFKFALDDCGIADNFNDWLLEEAVNEKLGTVRYTHTLARHPSGIVSVQERKVVVRDQDRMDTFRGSITKALWKLSEDFLIVDLSPNNHLNYGIDRDGRWCFIDASDLYPLVNIKDTIQCNKAIGWDDKKHKTKRCKGRLRYDSDFSAVICEHCGSEYMPLELRPKDKEDVSKMLQGMMDGYDLNDRRKWEEAELAAIHEKELEQQRAEQASTPPPPPTTPKREKQVFVDDRPRPQQPSSRVPTKENPDCMEIGGDDPPKPKGSKKNVTEDMNLSDQDDDDLHVEHGHVSEPSDASIRQNSTGFVPPENDEEEGEDDDDQVEPVFGGEHILSSDDDDEGEDKLHYSVVNVDDEDGDNHAAILITVTGDFDRAYGDYGLPVFLKFAGKNYSAMAISSETMKRIIDSVLPDIMEDAENS